MRRVVLMIESSRAYGRACLLGVAAYLRAHDPWQVLHLERGLAEEVSPLVRRWRADGIIARIETPRIAQAVTRLGVPTVDLRGEHRPHRAAMLDTDHDLCAQMAIEHFIARGFRDVAFCGYDGLGFSDRRRDALIAHGRRRGLNVHRFRSRLEEKVSQTLDREARGELDEHAIAHWLAGLAHPVGVFACNDVRGRQVLGACAAAGLAVPDAVAVLGVDNDEVLCELARPPLSSIEADAYRIGYEGAATLEAMMRGESAPSQTRFIPPRRVVVRRSTDVLAIDDVEVVQALRFIRDHACRGLRVDDVLGEVMVSRSTLERRFERIIGRTPRQEIQRVRLERVRRLLRETTYSLCRIATLTGYASASHLVTAFKQHTGQTPGHYRATVIDTGDA